MIGGFGTVDQFSILQLYICIITTVRIIIPDWDVVTLTAGSLTGPGNTVNAEILQLYSVNDVSPVIVPVVLVTVI